MFEQLAIWFLGFIAGFVVCYKIVNGVFKDIIEKFNIDKKELCKLYATHQELPRSSAETIKEVRIEQEANSILVYAKDTGEFLAQGNSVVEALRNLEKRFPDKSFKGNLSKEEADSLAAESK